ncbi:MAG: hypothetical protein AAFX99_36010, partial [Myxococcota bacterium]
PAPKPKTLALGAGCAVAVGSVSGVEGMAMAISVASPPTISSATCPQTQNTRPGGYRPAQP